MPIYKSDLPKVLSIKKIKQEGFFEQENSKNIEEVINYLNLYCDSQVSNTNPFISEEMKHYISFVVELNKKKENLSFTQLVQLLRHQITALDAFEKNWYKGVDGRNPEHIKSREYDSNAYNGKYGYKSLKTVCEEMLGRFAMAKYKVELINTIRKKNKSYGILNKIFYSFIKSYYDDIMGKPRGKIKLAKESKDADIVSVPTCYIETSNRISKKTEKANGNTTGYLLSKSLVTVYTGANAQEMNNPFHFGADFIEKNVKKEDGGNTDISQRVFNLCGKKMKLQRLLDSEINRLQKSKTNKLFSLFLKTPDEKINKLTLLKNDINNKETEQLEKTVDDWAHNEDTIKTLQSERMKMSLFNTVRVEKQSKTAEILEEVKEIAGLSLLRL